MKRLYLALAILGAVVPYIFLVAFFRQGDASVLDFVPAVFANHAAGMFAADLLISSGVFWLYMFTRRGPRPWLFIALNLFIGLSCALPAYLYANCRE